MSNSIPFDLYVLHHFSSHNRGIIERHEVTDVGCFYCCQVYPKSHIKDWTDSPRGLCSGSTAVCPNCGIDAVLPGIQYNERYLVYDGLLATMREAWFK